MVRNTLTRSVIATFLFAFVFSGCQTSNNKWATAWKERTKPKPKFQGIEGEEEVTYWPYKADKSRQKSTPMPDQIKEKLARKNEQKKRDSQLSELLNQGDQLRVGGQMEDARVAYTQALRIEPDNPSIHHRLAIIADKQRKFTAADEHYQAALKARPRDVNLLSDMGYSYSLRGNYQQAEATLKKALEIDHSHQGAMANLGDVYAKQNRRDEAFAMFRAGTSDAEAKSYMAKLFPDNRQGNAPSSDEDWGNSHSTPAMASNETSLDYKNMSFDEVKAEMARRGSEAKLRRQRADQAEMARAREHSAGEELARLEHSQAGNQYTAAPNRNHHDAQPANTAQMEDDWGNSAENSMAMGSQRLPQRTNDRWGDGRSPQPIEIVRGGPAPVQTGIPSDISSQYANQRNSQNGFQQPQNDGYGNQAPAMNGQDGNANLNASQYAAQLAMSVGPGSMFPVVPAVADGEIPSGEASSYNQRFGGEFQQSPSYQKQNPQNWSANSIEQTSVTDTAQIEGAPSIAPASPAANWGTPSSRRLNWQNENTTTADWANDSPNSGAAGTGLDSGAGRLIRNQAGDARRVASNQLNSDWQNQGQANSDSDPSRPYNGSWPNSNSLPSRQTQKPLTNGRSWESSNDNMQYGVGGDSSNAPATNGNTNSNSLPMWKYAPNR